MALNMASALIASLRERVARLRAFASEPSHSFTPTLEATVADLERIVDDLEVTDASLHRQYEDARLDRVASARQRRHYEGLFKFAPAGYLLTAADGVIMEANHTAAALFGGSIALLRGRNVEEYIAKGERRAFEELYTAVTQGAHNQARELRLVHVDGTPWIGTVNAVATMDAEGASTIRWSFHDISEARRQESLRPSTKSYRTLFELSPDPVLLLDPHSTDVLWKIVDCNDVLCTLHGYTRDELIGESASVFDAAVYDETTRQRFLDTLRSDGRFSSTTWHKRKDASIFPIGVSTSLVYLDNREYVLGVERDLTAMYEAEQALRRSEDFYRSLIENSSEIITVVDPDLVIRYKTPSLERVFGYPPTPNNLPIAGSVEWIHPDDQPRFVATFKQALQSTSMLGPLEMAVRHSDGTYRYIETIMHNMLDHPAVKGVVFNSHEITEHKRMEHALVHRTLHDALTGLPGRALFLERLATVLDQHQRDPSQQYAVVLFDIDRLKRINDIEGSQVGDMVLIEVAQRLKQCVRPTDTVARLGGDEYALILDHIADADEAKRIVEQAFAVLAESMIVDERALFIGVKCGVVIGTLAHLHPEQVLRDADVAKYRAKRRGCGSYEVFDAHLDEPVLEEMRLELDVQRAILHDELEMQFVVVRNVVDDSISAFEARLCWVHPRHGIMSPDTLVRLAAESGLLIPMLGSVMRGALAHLQAWQRDGFEGALMLTIPAPFFDLPHFAAEFAAFTSGQVDVLAQVEICVSERSLMADAGSVGTKLARLRDLGVQKFTIDDWGAGICTLRSLASLPFSSVRIGADLVQDLPDDTNAAMVLGTLRTLAGNLGLGVTVAGITSAEQRDFLRSAGIERYQGLPESALVRANDGFTLFRK